MNDRDAHVGLIQDLIWAPGRLEGWHAFLLHLSDAVGGSTASIISHESPPTIAWCLRRSDPDEMASYREHWSHLDPWAHRPAIGRLKSGQGVVGDALIAQNDIRRTAFSKVAGDWVPTEATSHRRGLDSSRRA